APWQRFRRHRRDGGRRVPPAQPHRHRSPGYLRSGAGLGRVAVMRHARTATVTASAAITLLVFAAPTFAGAGDPTASVSSGYSDPDIGVEYSSDIHYTGDDGENSPEISATPDSYFTVHDETSGLIAGGVWTGGGPPGADVSCQVEPQGLPPR